MRIRNDVCCHFALTTALVALGLYGVPSDTLAAETAPDSPQFHLAVEDPRPVAKAADELMRRYGYLVSYEDPRYMYFEDIRDVTEEVRKDLSQHAPGRAPRALVPARGFLELRNVQAPQPGDLRSATSLLHELLNVQANRSNGGLFRLEQIEGRFHILPARVRDATGEWVDQASILDARITVPVAERDGMATVREILAAVAQATGVSVVVGTVPLNLLARARISLGAENEIARSVLIRALDATGSRITWKLFFGPDVRMYALNLQVIPDRNAQDRPAPSQNESSRPAGAPPFLGDPR